MRFLFNNIIHNNILQYIKYRLAHRGSECQLVFNNQKIYVRKNSTDFKVVRSIFELDEFKTIAQLIHSKTRKTAGVVIDAGANIGASSIRLSELFPNSIIIAIEPDSNNWELLKKNTEKIQRIIPLKAALAAEISIRSIYKRGEDNYLGRTINPLAPGITGEHQTTRTTTINTLQNDYKTQTFQLLKCDVEGAELEIMQSCAAESFDAIFIELHPQFDKSINETWEKWTAGRNNSYESLEKVLSLKSRAPS